MVPGSAGRQLDRGRTRAWHGLVRHTGVRHPAPLTRFSPSTLVHGHQRVRIPILLLTCRYLYIVADGTQLRCSPRRAAGGRRGDPAADRRPAAARRADRHRPHRHPRPVAAADLAPPQAARRGRASSTSTAKARGRSSTSPATGRSPSWSPTSLRYRGPRPRARRRPRPARGRSRPPRRRRAGVLRRESPTTGTRNVRCTPPTRSSRAAILESSATPTDRCSTSAPAPGACCSCWRGRRERAVGIDNSHSMLAVARANLERAEMRRVDLRQGDIYSPPFDTARSTSSSSTRCCTSSTIRRAPSARRPPAVTGRPVADRRLRAALARVPAHRARPSPARVPHRHRQRWLAHAGLEVGSDTHHRLPRRRDGERLTGACGKRAQRRVAYGRRRRRRQRADAA